MLSLTLSHIELAEPAHAFAVISCGPHWGLTPVVPDTDEPWFNWQVCMQSTDHATMIAEKQNTVKMLLNCEPCRELPVNVQRTCAGAPADPRCVHAVPAGHLQEVCMTINLLVWYFCNCMTRVIGP